jgi:hypothetical protein
MPGGYRCNGKGHAMTDEILAEGRGGLFGLPTHDWNKREGPYYPSPNSPGKYYMVTKNENHGSTRPPERA